MSKKITAKKKSASRKKISGKLNATSACWRSSTMDCLLFPPTVLELTSVLSGPSPDIKKAAKLIRTDAALSAQLLRMCSSAVFDLRSRVVSIDQAATVLGADRLRTLVLTGSMVDLVGSGLPREQSTRFWQHSFLAAMLSEHLAKYTGYSEQERAYIAGLLHDIGQVLHWMLVREGKSQKKTAPPENWFDNPPVERDYFELDHCKLGSYMATNWNFMPSFIDVLINYHQPAKAEHDPYLVQVVGAVEHFLLTRVQEELWEGVAPEPSSEQRAAEIDISEIAERSSQSYGDSWQAIAEDLDTEYTRLLPIVKSGLTTVIAGSK